MKTYKVRALVTLDGVPTESFKGMPKSEEEDKKLKRIKEDFIIAMRQWREPVDVRIIESKEETK